MEKKLCFSSWEVCKCSLKVIYLKENNVIYFVSFLLERALIIFSVISGQKETLLTLCTGRVVLIFMEGTICWL